MSESTKVMILAGGMGTRLAEETDVKPKPMVEIGGHPIIWHIMKSYASQGFNEFVICLGHKGRMIRDFFMSGAISGGDFEVDLASGSAKRLGPAGEDWKITLVETGETSGTGCRIAQAAKYVGERFLLTYGDGLSDVDVNKTIEFHKSHGKLVTVTAVHPIARFGHMQIGDDGTVDDFVEKPIGDGGWINGGFFVVERRAVDTIGPDPSTMWEHAPLSGLAKRGELMALLHNGFWHPMDTLRDKRHLDSLWASGTAPWRSWK